jgi:hypothetical protein
VRSLAILVSLPFLFACHAMPGHVTSGHNTDCGLARITSGVSRAVTWENRTGEVGGGGRSASKLGVGRKGSPAIRRIKPGQTKTLMDVAGTGIIQHIWATTNARRKPSVLRNLILRMYWDGCPVPSVEVPWGDFFAMPHGEIMQINSALVHSGHEPGRSFNCYFAMPFSRRARITITNESDIDIGSFYYQIDYDLVPALPPGAGRFHAVFQRDPKTTMKRDFELLRTEQGPGHIVGIVMGLQTTDTNWWGEGEVKCFLDGDTDFPTICGTGLEDYYCSAFGMGEFQTPYAGCPRLHKTEEAPNPIVSLYRWHVPDPIRWRKNARVTVQQIGWRRKHGLYERSDDYSSVVYYYVPKPESKRPPLADKALRSLKLRGD